MGLSATWWHRREKPRRSSDFRRARRFKLSLQVEDEHSRVVDAIRDLQVELENPSDLQKILLRLNIALHAKE
ncbi:MAG: hypothetical protein L0191_04380 [Acidobacteria bacterium]|nr:hypothetical protein [Acidobacteriota bacterium]